MNEKKIQIKRVRCPFFYGKMKLLLEAVTFILMSSADNDFY